MKVAISSEEKNGLESRVSHHFGRCPYYVLVDIQDEQILGFKEIENPFYAQHQPGMVPEFIKGQGVDMMISGGMGRRAIGFFDQFGIQVATGANGTVRSTLNDYFNGHLRGAEPCRDSVEHHKHGHH
jgi:predicted Fe-Mo cluster-binding NifX family protein